MFRAVYLALCFAAPAAAAPVNCGQYFQSLQTAQCVAVEEMPRQGCGKDRHLAKNELWIGPSQMKIALQRKAVDPKICVSTFGQKFSKESCCRVFIPKPPPRKASPKAAKPAARKTVPARR